MEVVTWNLAPPQDWRDCSGVWPQFCCLTTDSFQAFPPRFASHLGQLLGQPGTPSALEVNFMQTIALETHTPNHSKNQGHLPLLAVRMNWLAGVLGLFFPESHIMRIINFFITPWRVVSCVSTSKSVWGTVFIPPPQGKLQSRNRIVNGRTLGESTRRAEFRRLQRLVLGWIRRRTLWWQNCQLDPVAATRGNCHWQSEGAMETGSSARIDTQTRKGQVPCSSSYQGSPEGHNSDSRGWWVKSAGLASTLETQEC